VVPRSGNAKGAKSSSTAGERKGVQRRLPLSWEPPPNLYKWAEDSCGFDRARVDTEVEHFRDYHIAKGSIFADWTAAARTWLRNAKSFQRVSPNASTARQPTGGWKPGMPVETNE
jgi:hypothetical protein